MIEQAGAWPSEEVVLWQSSVDDEKDLLIINTYRHKLMETFVLNSNGVKSTKINTYTDVKGKIRTTFEFTLNEDIDPFNVVSNTFERKVSRLIEAVKAERELEEAKSKASRYSFP